jgi:hypothetical protein
MWVAFNSEGCTTVLLDKPDKPNTLKTVIVYTPQAKHTVLLCSTLLQYFSVTNVWQCTYLYAKIV